MFLKVVKGDLFMFSSFKKVCLSLKNNKIVWLAIMLLLLNLGLVFHYFSLKNNLHLDEQWSYAHANSSQGAFLTSGADHFLRISDVAPLFNRWINFPSLNDYITVQQDEVFKYSHIWDNLKVDVHPPLYHVLLHTVSSFFVDNISKWHGAGLNIVIWVALLFVLYKLADLIFKDKFIDLAVVCFYAFSMVGLNTVLFIRMYALQTLLAVCLIYQVLLMLEDKGISKKRIGLIFLFSALGNLTHFNSLIFSFIVSVCGGVYLLKQRDYKKLVAFGLAMFLGFVLLLILFPYSNDIIFGSARGKEIFDKINYKYVILWLLVGIGFICAGIVIVRHYDIKRIFKLERLALVIGVGLYILYLRIDYDFDEMRHLLDDFFNKLYFGEFITTRLISFTNINVWLFILGVIVYAILIKIRFVRKDVWFLLSTSVLMGMCLNYFMPHMYHYRDRYFFIIMPMFSILIGYLFVVIYDRFLSNYKAKILLMSALVLLNSCMVNFEKNSPYSFGAKDKDMLVWAEIKDKPVFLITSERWMIYELVYYLKDAKKVYMTLPNIKDTFFYEMDRNKDAYLLVFNKDTRFGNSLDYPRERLIVPRILAYKIKFITTVRASERYYDVYKVR